MLIWIDKTVLAVLTSDNKSDADMRKVNQALTQIVDGRKNHRHIIWGTRSVLEEIQNYYKNSEGESSEKYNVFKKVLDKYYKKENVFNKISKIYYVKVVCDESITNMNERYININILDCPNRRFDFFLNQTVLLFENNEDDMYYYNPIAIKYCRENGYGKIGGENNSGLILDYDDRHTGGSSVEPAIENKIIKMNCFCLGLTDSDNEYGTIPSTGICYQPKDTATWLKFKAIASLLELFSKTKGDSIKNFLYMYHVLEVRDVENLIPINTIQSYDYANSNNVFANIEQINSILDNDEKKIENFHKYFDYENGIYEKTDEKGNKNINEIQFWTEVLNISANSLPILRICSKDFMKNCGVEKNKKDDKQSDLQKKWGAKGALVASCPPIKKLPTVLQNEWCIIGKLILSFCCAYKEKL